MLYRGILFFKCDYLLHLSHYLSPVEHRNYPHGIFVKRLIVGQTVLSLGNA